VPGYVCTLNQGITTSQAAAPMNATMSHSWSQTAFKAGNNGGRTRSCFQTTFQIFVGPGGFLTFGGQGGPVVVSDAVGNQFTYGANIGPLVKNVWYDF